MTFPHRLDIDRGAGKDSAEARVQIGGMLLDVRDLLPHGEWLAWLAAEVPYRERAARYYIGLHRWTRDNPDLFVRAAPLGPGKLYYLTRLDRPALANLLRQKLVTIPGSGERLSLQQASAQQLGCRFRAMPITDSGRCRSPIPVKPIRARPHRSSACPNCTAAYDPGSRAREGASPSKPE